MFTPLEYRPTTTSGIHFPFWVRKPSPCKTQTNSHVAPKGSLLGSQHGAIRREYVHNPSPFQVVIGDKAVRVDMVVPW